MYIKPVEFVTKTILALTLQVTHNPKNLRENVKGKKSKEEKLNERKSKKNKK